MVTERRWAIAEILAVFLLVMIAIWFFQPHVVPFTATLVVLASVVILGFIVRFRRSRSIVNYAAELGLGRRELEKDEYGVEREVLKVPCSWVWQLTCGTAIALELVLIAGWYFRPNFWLAEDFWKVKIFVGVQKYAWWGMLQQFFLHGFVTSNLYFIFAKTPNPTTCEERAAIFTSLISGILFFIVHAPNPTLMIITPIAGAATAYIFLHCRNIYMLGIAHGILGTAIKWCLSDNMRVGPHYWQWTN